MKRWIREIYNGLTFRRRINAQDQEMLRISVPLLTRHVQGCRVFPDRKSLIESFPKRGVVAEVGVASGEFSSVILEMSQPKRLFLIDAWSMVGHPNYGEGGYQQVRERFENELETEKIRILRGYSHEALAELEDRSLDWIYIDAAHDYRSVKNDLNIAFHKVKHGGIIAGHDYHRWGRFGKRLGVLEAVNEFCVQKDLSFVGLSLENNLNWSYALQVIQ